MRLPDLQGRPVEIRFVRGLTDRCGAVHGGAFLRERLIAFDSALERRPREFRRIFVHELFHFAWVRLSNGVRRQWEAQLDSECARGAHGELGWSSEWRKAALRSADRKARSRRWREYCCESFCDSAAWLLAGLDGHPEFTLAPRFREQRRRWFARSGVSRRISI